MDDSVVYTLSRVPDYNETLQIINGEVEDVLTETIEFYTAYYKPIAIRKKCLSNMFIVTPIPYTEELEIDAEIEPIKHDKRSVISLDTISNEKASNGKSS